MGKISYYISRFRIDGIRYNQATFCRSSVYIYKITYHHHFAYCSLLLHIGLCQHRSTCVQVSKDMIEDAPMSMEPEPHTFFNSEFFIKHHLDKPLLVMALRKFSFSYFLFIHHADLFMSTILNNFMIKLLELTLYIFGYRIAVYHAQCLCSPQLI